jgi:hypothetical protein
MLDPYDLSEIERHLVEWLRGIGVQELDIDKATFHQPQLGTMYWQWGSGKGSKLWKTFIFRDEDQVPVFISISRREARIQEIELWRGDGNAIRRFPLAKNIKLVDKPGIVEI